MIKAVTIVIVMTLVHALIDFTFHLWIYILVSLTYFVTFISNTYIIYLYAIPVLELYIKSVTVYI